MESSVAYTPSGRTSRLSGSKSAKKREEQLLSIVTWFDGLARTQTFTTSFGKETGSKDAPVNGVYHPRQPVPLGSNTPPSGRVAGCARHEGKRARRDHDVRWSA